MHIFLGLAVTTGLWSLIPSKLEDEQSVPVASILLAILSGICVALGSLQ
jgi:hypothetical protein